MAKRKTFPRVSGMETVNREHHGNSHGIHVIRSAAYGFEKNGFRVKRSPGDLFPVHHGIADSHARAAAYGIGALAASERVPNHAPMLGHDASVRANCRRRIVGFSLDGQGPAVIKRHDTRIALER